MHSPKLPDEERVVRWTRHPTRRNTVVSVNEHGVSRTCEFLTIRHVDEFLLGKQTRDLPLLRFDEYSGGKRGRKAQDADNPERAARMEKVRARRAAYSKIKIGG